MRPQHELLGEQLTAKQDTWECSGFSQIYLYLKEIRFLKWLNRKIKEIKKDMI